MTELNDMDIKNSTDVTITGCKLINVDFYNCTFTANEDNRFYGSRMKDTINNVNVSPMSYQSCTFENGDGIACIESATPQNIIVLPGCSSNVPVGGNVTQLASNVLVDVNVII